MQWASAISAQADAYSALTEIKRSISEQLKGAHADMVCLFVSPHYADSFAYIPELVLTYFSPQALIGGSLEIEQRAAISLSAALLPGVELHNFHLEEYPGPDEGPEAWEQALGVPRTNPAHFVLLADPMGRPPCDPLPLLAGIDYAYPNSVQIGGLASVIDGNTLYS